MIHDIPSLSNSMQGSNVHIFEDRNKRAWNHSICSDYMVIERAFANDQTRPYSSLKLYWTIVRNCIWKLTQIPCFRFCIVQCFRFECSIEVTPCYELYDITYMIYHIWYIIYGIWILPRFWIFLKSSSCDIFSHNFLHRIEWDAKPWWCSKISKSSQKNRCQWRSSQFNQLIETIWKCWIWKIMLTILYSFWFRESNLGFKIRNSRFVKPEVDRKWSRAVNVDIPYIYNLANML